jgi:hypothetical protein
VLQHQNETLRAELAETRKAVDAFHRSAAAMAVELVGLRAEVTRKDHGWKLALDELEKSDEELDALKAGRAAAEWQLQEALETIGALPLMPDEAPADLGPLTPHPPPYPVRWTHPPDEECIHCATPDRLASADPVIDCPREECPFDRATRARRPARRIRSVSDKISANLPGIQKSTMSVPGVWSGPKEGDRITVDLGNGKMIDHIATGVTRDGYGGFSVASRPATPEDGPRTREQRKMVRAMRWSRCRWKMRAWVDRVFRLEARPA